MPVIADHDEIRADTVMIRAVYFICLSSHGRVLVDCDSNDIWQVLCFHAVQNPVELTATDEVGTSPCRYVLRTTHVGILVDSSSLVRLCVVQMNCAASPLHACMPSDEQA